MKLQRDIEKDLIQLFASLQNKVTNFVIGSVARSFFTSISATVAEVWNDLTTIQRNLFWTTARGSNLDYLGNEVGLPRLGATQAESIVVFNGTFITGSSTSIATNALTDTSKTFTVNDFINGAWVLVDSALKQFDITGNTVDTVYVTANDDTGYPSAGTYYVLPKVPAGTIVRNSVSNIGYVTQWDVIVGRTNLPLAGQSTSTSLGDRTIVVAEVAGSTGVAQANTITVISPAINGVASCTNPVPTQPRTGLDSETDDQYRNRRKNIISLLNIDTQAFYEAHTFQFNNNVLRSIAKKNFANDGVKLLLRSRNSGDFTAQDLLNIASDVAIYSRSFEVITAENMPMTDITISFKCSFKNTLTLAGMYVQIADAIANYIDYATWVMTDDLIDDKVIEQILKLSDIIDIDLASFSLTAQKDAQPAGSGRITFIESYPRFARLAVTNIADNTTLDYVLSQAAIRVIKTPIEPYTP